MKSFLIFSLFLLTGCSSIKKMAQSVHSVFERHKSHHALKQSFNKISIDTSLSVQLEWVDTSVKLSASIAETLVSAKDSKDYDALLDGLKTLDSSLLIIRVNYDSLQKKIKTVAIIPERTIPVKRFKYTYSKNGNSIHTASKSTGKKNDIRIINRHQANLEKLKKIEPVHVSLVAWAAIILTLTILVIFLVKRFT